MLSSGRQERRKQRTRQRILDAARHVITTHGFDATGILDITEEADVSKGTFYLYFKDKEDLTKTLISEGFETLRELLDEVLDSGSGLENVAEALRVVFAYAENNHQQFIVMLGRRASAELNMLAMNYYTEVVEDILARSGVTSETLSFPPALVAQFVAGACVRLGSWWLEDKHGLSADEIADITYRMLTDGALNVLPPDVRPSKGS